MGGFFDPKEQEMESTSEVGLPAEFKPYLERGLNWAESLSGQPRTLPDFDMTVGMSPERRAGLENMYGLAAGGGSVVPGAVSELNRTLSGEYLEPGALRAATQGAVNRAIPNVNAQFFGQGGGGALRGAAMTEAMGNVMSDQYSRERGNMMRGLALSPSIENLGYTPSRTMMDVGSAYEADQSRQLGEDLLRFQFPQEEERIRMGEYMGALGGLLPFAGQTQSNQWTEYGPSPFETVAGVAGTVAGIGGPSGFGWWGGGRGGGGMGGGFMNPFSSPSSGPGAMGNLNAGIPNFNIWQNPGY